MKYVKPFDELDPDAHYVNGQPDAGIEGSVVPQEAIEHPMREIVHVIQEAGLIPTGEDLTQLYMAIAMMIQAAMPKRQETYELCEFYHFRNPQLRAGFKPAHGGLLENAATLHPEAWEYLKTTEGQALCKTELDWQAMTKATWATLADGTKVGWNGIGGAPFYAPDFATGALRLPDLRGMYAEAAGYDTLGVGGVHGDFLGQHQHGIGFNQGLILTNGSSANRVLPSPSTEILSGNVTGAPTAKATKPRAWGALACCYLGAPR